MLKSFALAIITIVLYNVTNAQPNYWQQRVDHKINVTLDDKNHVLRGNETIEYTNNSPDTLRFIYIELYPNAYSRKNTAFAKEQIRTGDLTFQKAKPEQMGFIDSLSFTANAQPLKLELDAVNPDYAKLYLNEPLAPGKTITLETPFRYKLNHTFSRGGHVGQSYQISQWFPKPAVYDKYGWHPMPYLENGEYYAEYGDYEVNITLPANYLIGATGNLQNEDEKNWLNAQAAAYESKLDKSAYLTNPLATDDNIDNATTSGFPTSSKQFKTLRYTASNVQDFAWFADKRFYVLKSEVTLPHSGRQVDSWVYFHSDKRRNLWGNAHRYVDSSLYYYSKWVGDYAHDQATAVEGALVAGGGMEYPMVTVIGDTPAPRLLENVIAHEVGHNWFQGTLGSNERDHPWMDEGLNSYYERRYMEATKPKNDTTKRTGLQATIDALSNIQESDLPYLYQARRNYQQPTCSRAPDLTTMNVGIMVYMKTPLLFEYLESYIGTEGVDSLMQQYYDECKFKHPQPDDIRRIFDASGVELDWLFEDMLCTTKHVDYKLSWSPGYKVFAAGEGYPESVFQRLVVKNKGGVKGPYSISAYNKDGKVLHTQRYGGFLEKNDVLFPYHQGTAAYRLDAEERMPEYRRQDNTMRTRGLFRKMEPVKFRLFTGLEKPYRTTINVALAVGANLYDGFQVGLALHNFRVPMNNVEWALVPMYAARSERPTGLARIQGYVYPTGLQHFRMHAMVSSFAYAHGNLEEVGNVYPYFLKATGGAEVRFKSKSFSVWNTLGIQGFFIQNNQTVRFLDSPPYVKRDDYLMPRTAFELKYGYENKRPINPFGFSLRSRLLTEFRTPAFDKFYRTQLDVMSEFNYRFSYTKSKGLDIRLFSGVSSDDMLPLHLGATPGYHDVTYSHYFIGRSEGGTEGLYAQQVLLNEGALKFVTPPYVNDGLGDSRFIASVNVKSSLPIPLFFVFADAGTRGEDSSFDYERVVYDAGLGLSIIPKVFEIYLPLLFSNDLKTQVINPYRTEWYERIVFTLQFENLDPFKLIRNINVN